MDYIDDSDNTPTRLRFYRFSSDIAAHGNSQNDTKMDNEFLVVIKFNPLFISSILTSP